MLFSSFFTARQIGGLYFPPNPAGLAGKPAMFLDTEN
jgi:hypothetical protein